MAETVTMPKLGFDMAEGTLIRWVIQEGDAVQKGAVLAEIETDKATVEVESTYDGVVARHLVAAGDIVPVNTPIAVIAAPGENIEAAETAAPESTPQKTTPDAAPTADVPARQPDEPAPTPAAQTEGDASLPGGVRASPLARRMASEMRINLRQVPGSGPGGRILKRDVEGFLSAPLQDEAAAKAPAPQPTAAPKSSTPALTPLAPLAGSGTPADEVLPLNRLRAAIGRRMVESKQQVPHFYVTREYDVELLMNLRKQVNTMLPNEEKISVNDFIVKAVALALRNFPNLNAAFQGDKIVRFGGIHIGVAVAVENGLLTVVVRDADRKPMRQIAVETKAMSKRAREGKVRPEDIEGSTFSTSNLGMFDVEHFVAIINPPEAGILAIGAAKETPIVKNGELTVGWRMKATISVDHRVSDGAEGARFMQALAAYIEEPLRLLV